MTPPSSVPTQLGEDPFGLIHIARVRKGRIASHKADEIPWHAFSMEPFEEKRAKDRERKRRPEKVHERLRELLDERGGDERDQVLVSFREDLSIPRFPEPNPDQTRRSQTNRGAARSAQRLVKEIAGQRGERYEDLTRELREHKAKPLERFWLINALLVEIPLGEAVNLAERDDVVYVEPRFSGEEPPQDEVDDGRARARQRSLLQPRPDRRLDRPPGHRRSLQPHAVQLSPPTSTFCATA